MPPPLPPAQPLPLALLLAATLATATACGAAAALFLALLERVTVLRAAHTGLVVALPMAGALLGWVWARWGGPLHGGTVRVLDAVRGAAGPLAGPRLPLRMAPLVLAGTLWTHLFGGSAGREGTALQMGGSLSAWVLRGLQGLVARGGRGGFRGSGGVDGSRLGQLCATAGVAAGFGAVFGTPWAAVVFAIELAPARQLRHGGWAVALLAAWWADAVALRCGAVHTAWPTLQAVPLTAVLALRWLAVALAVGLAARGFLLAVRAVARAAGRLPGPVWLRPAVGGAVVAAVALGGAKLHLLGLSLPMAQQALGGPVQAGQTVLQAGQAAVQAGQAAVQAGTTDLQSLADGLLKLVLTALTVGSGWVGGEVTPLLAAGAALGRGVAAVAGVPPGLAAAVAIVSLWGAAARMPWTVAVLAWELLGPATWPHAPLVALLAAGVAAVRAGQGGLYAQASAATAPPQAGGH